LTQKSYKELAEDFKTFVGSCKSKKIGHVRTVEERRQGMIDRGYGSRSLFKYCSRRIDSGIGLNEAVYQKAIKEAASITASLPGCFS